MRLDSQFIVPADPQRAWKFLTDLNLVAPCLPGASVDSIEGDEVTGRVVLRIGPMNMTYTGQAHFVVKDDVNKLATIEAGGRDGRSGGTAKAKIKASLVGVPGGTRVDLSTDLGLTGRVAQLGQGPINDISSKLMSQFADCLASRIGQQTLGAFEDNAATSGGVGIPTTAAGGRAPAKAVEPINMLDASLLPKKIIAVAAAGLAALILVTLLGRRHGKKEAYR